MPLSLSPLSRLKRFVGTCSPGVLNTGREGGRHPTSLARKTVETATAQVPIAAAPPPTTPGGSVESAKCEPCPPAQPASSRMPGTAARHLPANPRSGKHQSLASVFKLAVFSN